jgi:hypothetical protein
VSGIQTEVTRCNTASCQSQLTAQHLRRIERDQQKKKEGEVSPAGIDELSRYSDERSQGGSIHTQFKHEVLLSLITRSRTASTTLVQSTKHRLQADRPNQGMLVSSGCPIYPRPVPQCRTHTTRQRSQRHGNPARLMQEGACSRQFASYV